MKRSSLLKGVIASSAILISASANATVTLSIGGAAASDGSGLVSFIAPTTYNMNAGNQAPLAGSSVLFTTGSVDGQNAAPFGDGTMYASVGTNVSPATDTLLLSSTGNHYLGLYWGSIDTFNTIEITDSSGTTDVNAANFLALAPANGFQGSGGSAYVNIFDTDGITGIKFISTQKAFEFDNLTLSSAVPEPSTWAMMILGFFGLGFLGYRKSLNSSDASFRMA